MLRLKQTNHHKRFFGFQFSSHSDPNYLNCHLDFFLSKQTSTLQSFLQSHALVVTSGNSSNIFIASKLISLYASFNEPVSSTKLFNSIQPKDVFLWNSIIQSHFSNGNYEGALDFYLQMRASCTLPSQFTVPMVATTCAELMLLNHGMNVHGLALKLGLFAGNSAVGSSFVYMYSKCGLMGDASHVFDEITSRDVVAWTALVVGYVQNDESEKGLKCFCEMHRIGGVGEKPNSRTLEAGLQACANLGSLVAGRCLHGLLVKDGVGRSQLVLSSLFSMYCKCGLPLEAYICFCELSNKDILSWTSIIAVYAKFGLMIECLSLFWEMQSDEIYPDEIVISCIISAFGNSLSVPGGKAFHGLVLRQHYVISQMVQNALLSMYCKFGLLTVAEKLFCNFNVRNKQDWNIMIVGYGHIGKADKCIELFREMQKLGIESDLNSLVSVVSSCSQIGSTYLARSVHCYIIKNSMNVNISIANSLIDMYGKSVNLTAALRIFSTFQPDIVSWNALISSYICCGHYAEAITLFEELISKNLKPNPVTCITTLSACAHLASLEKGEMVHRYIKQNGFKINLSLATALVDMYVKCGRLEVSRELFDSTEERDVVSWNVMISGYGMHGYAESAIQVFQLMEKSNVKPNNTTFLALLSACTHSGLVEEGRRLFRRMQKHYSLTPNLKHYACMVDLLGRSGNLEEAEELVLSMPISPDGGVWGSLLSACKIHNNVEMGTRVAKYAIEIDPENDGYYIVLSNMYDSSGRWEEAEEVRNVMKRRGVEKRSGWSSV